MPPNTLRVHTEHVLVKSVDPKSCGLSHERRDWRIFPSPSVQCRNWGGGGLNEGFQDRVIKRGLGVENAPISSFGTFRRDPSIFVCPGVVDSDSGNREKSHAYPMKEKE
ncbi:hypothetical protein TNCV_4155601 [Trichonephila clavipes]|nr:hypothetical protein TNCV_4155601 [Trichonephila clavipes]